MNKKGMMIKVITIVFMITLFVTPSVHAGLLDIFGNGNSAGTSGVSTNFPTKQDSIDEVDSAVQKIWGTVLTITQILAFAAVVFAGVRYMFASADQKADIKKGLGMLTIGAILVFAASTVVKFVVGVAGEIIGQ